MSSDYHRIARAIEWLENRVEEQPGLEELATAMDLSPAHAQRLFRRWAGLTPKQFLQVLTAAAARKRCRT